MGWLAGDHVELVGFRVEALWLRVSISLAHKIMRPVPRAVGKKILSGTRVLGFRVQCLRS